MIRLENVTSGYGRKPVLKEVNLHIERGEMAAVLGPNGSGKTTMLLTLCGILPVLSGSIEINGRALNTLRAKEQARQMAAVPQRLEAAFNLKVMSVVLMGRYPHISFLGGYQERDREIALESLRQTRTEHLKDRFSNELSGGEFQRVIIARALAQEADILLLDEAASGLDIARKIEIYDLLVKKNREGTTILTAIHDLNLAALYCPRLVFLKKGRVALDGPSIQVFTEENLKRVYETDLKVLPHPLTSAPQAHLVPGHGYLAD